ncbi:two-component system response regulator BtsR [Iodobacter ciconiae]|nr:two-component system response regulator BtsR [Iodobacter ciconiae]
MMLTALIIDDEPLARDELRALLAADTQIEIVGEAANAIDAMAGIHRWHPDIIFLDIQMPKINGLELVAMLDPECLPHIVFVTAFDEFALRAFEEHAFDYLLKPVEAARLSKTLERLHKVRLPQNIAALTPVLNQLPCHGHNRICLMPTAEVEYACSKLSGVYLVGQDAQEHFTVLTLKTLELKTVLLRCHRQYLVNPERISEIVFSENGAAEILTRSQQRIPVSRRYLKVLKDALGIDS